LADFNAAIRLDPRDAIAYYNRGVTHTDLGRHVEALADFDAAIRLDTNYTQAYCNRGFVHARLGHYVEALADYDAAIRLNPNLAAPHLNKGLLYSERDEWDQALAAFEAAAELGERRGTECAAKVREITGMSPAAASSAEVEALAALLRAREPADMHSALTRYPILARPDFVELIERGVAENLSPAERPAIRQRLDWLRQFTPHEGTP
jgi:tetratricopeptide (TPR) repeat protein